MILPLILSLVASPAGGNALWVWQTDIYSKRGDFFEFCATKNITTVFLSIGAPFEERGLKLFMIEAAARNIRVEALLGKPIWALESDVLLTKISELLEFSRENPEARFKGIVLDIEPYTLPQWEKSKEKIIESYIEVMKRAKGASGILPLTICIPYWFSQLTSEGKDRPLSHRLIDIVDRVAIMDYTVNKESFVANVKRDLGYAYGQGKGVWIGINFHPFEEKSATLFRMGKEESENMIREARIAFNPYPSFLGIAYHDYHSYCAWLAKRR